VCNVALEGSIEAGACGAVSWQGKEREREREREGWERDSFSLASWWLPRGPHLSLIKGYRGSHETQTRRDIERDG